MVTFSDAQAAPFPTFEAFLTARRIVREAAAEQIAALRVEQSRALESLAQHFQDVRAQTESQQIGIVGSAALLAQLRVREMQDTSAIKSRFGRKIDEVYERYGLERGPRKQRIRDAQDYAHAADVFRDDVTGNANVGIDPILQALPGSRRRRENGWFVYESAILHGALGRRELLRCNDAQIIVRGSDDDRIRAGLKLAAERYGAPICITGTPSFVERSRAIADELGIAHQAATQTAPEVRAPNAASGESPAQRPDVARKYVVMPTDERLETLKSELGARFVAALSKITKTMKLDGVAVRRLPGFWDDADGIVVMVDDNALVVPVDPGFAVELNSTVRIAEASDGRFTLEIRAQSTEPAAPAQSADAEPVETQDEVLTPARSQGR